MTFLYTEAVCIVSRIIEIALLETNLHIWADVMF